MKILLDTYSRFSYYLRPTVTEEELEDFHEHMLQLCKLAESLGCQNSLDCTEAGVEIIVLQQKVTLESVAMNTLFSEFFSELFDSKLEYAQLGGEGCDFSMRVTLSQRVDFVWYD